MSDKNLLGQFTINELMRFVLSHTDDHGALAQTINGYDLTNPHRLIAVPIKGIQSNEAQLTREDSEEFTNWLSVRTPLINGHRISFDDVRQKVCIRDENDKLVSDAPVDGIDLEMEQHIFTVLGKQPKLRPHDTEERNPQKSVETSGSLEVGDDVDGFLDKLLEEKEQASKYDEAIDPIFYDMMDDQKGDRPYPVVGREKIQVHTEVYLENLEDDPKKILVFSGVDLNIKVGEAYFHKESKHFVARVDVQPTIVNVHTGRGGERKNIMALVKRLYIQEL